MAAMFGQVNDALTDKLSREDTMRFVKDLNDATTVSEMTLDACGPKFRAALEKWMVSELKKEVSAKAVALMQDPTRAVHSYVLHVGCSRYCISCSLVCMLSVYPDVHEQLFEIDIDKLNVNCQWSTCPFGTRI